MLVKAVSALIVARTWKVFQIFPESLRTILNQREVQAMVIISLSFQSILMVMGYRRRYTSNYRLNMVLWVAYLSADWFATVALSIISNNLGEKPIDPELIMTAFWAPFFLLHLGGLDTITAYSLEDNTLWRRHALSLVSQVTVGGYIFLRAWNNTQLNYIAAPLFIPGLIKIGERIWVLRSASSENFKASMLSKPDPGPNYARYMEEYLSKKEEGFKVQSCPSIEATVVADVSFVAPKNVMIPGAASLQDAYILFRSFRPLFADLILGIQDIKNSQSFFHEVNSSEAFEVIEVELGFMYDVLYTKAFKVYSKTGVILRLLSFSSTMSVLLAFLIIDKDDYSRDDILITYILLVGAIVLEIYTVLVLVTSDWTLLWLSERKNAAVDILYRAISSVRMYGIKRWSNTMGQYNLIRYCLHQKPAKCSVVQRFLFNHDFLEKIRFQQSAEVSKDLKKLIFDQLVKKSKNTSYEACKELCESRGKQVLINAKCYDCTEKDKRRTHEENPEIESEPLTKDAKCIYEISKDDIKTVEESIEAEFDQSILLWHIATTLCHYSDYCPNSEVSKLISEYMLYLLVMRPVMLPNGIEQIRFQDTCAEATDFLKQRKISDVNQACRKLLDVSTAIPPSEVKGDRSKSVLFDGCKLAKSLQCLETEKKWEFISHVWVEMLCYAATKCRWNRHAQQLCRGGELLTHVWLLMAHLGITEQFQISKGHARVKLIVH
ncbi:uncharacterized protein LOC142637096 [Castanea sativa]|uniref:uncharacterized protein LOC142637096 n=1 Tax=Castanea sativa TaxID=21020 RepID=UPI003F652162